MNGYKTLENYNTGISRERWTLSTPRQYNLENNLQSMQNIRQLSSANIYNKLFPASKFNEKLVKKIRDGKMY